MENLQRTPFHDKQVALGAKMVPFAGWSLPVQFSGIMKEHIHTREKATLFDTSHMGEFLIQGKDALGFLQYIMTNDLERLSPGDSGYSVICNEQGYALDDCFIYMFSREKFLVVVNAANRDSDFQWMQDHSHSFGVTLEDVTSRMAKLDVQGPRSGTILEKTFNIDQGSLKRFQFMELPGENLICSRTGYTGEDGFELYIETKSALDVWDRLFQSGDDLIPAGLGARDSLRLESCYSLYGHELDTTITPVEAGLGWAVRTYKENFIGKEVLQKQKEGGTQRKLAAFEMERRAIPRHGYKILYGQEESGFVTSGTFSPTLQKSIGLGFMQSGHITLGAEIGIEIRGKTHAAKIVKKPFYKYKGGSDG